MRKAKKKTGSRKKKPANSEGKSGSRFKKRAAGSGVRPSGEKARRSLRRKSSTVAVASFQEASKVAASMPLEPVQENVAILSGHAPFDPAPILKGDYRDVHESTPGS